MRRFIITIIATSLLVVSFTTWALKHPRPATAEDAQGVWLGYTEDGEFYRVDLKANGQGTIADTLFTEPASLYRIESWTLSIDWKLSIVGRGIDDFAGENIFITGKLFGSPSKMIIGNHKDWQRELILINEQLMLEQSQLTKDRAKMYEAH